MPAPDLSWRTHNTLCRCPLSECSRGWASPLSCRRWHTLAKHSLACQPQRFEMGASISEIKHIIQFKRFNCKHECQNFPGNKIPGRKISRQNIPGWKILGPENSRNTNFSWNSRIFFWENSRIFFFRGQKIPGFLAPLFSRIENSVTEFPRIFWPFFGFFGQNKT